MVEVRKREHESTESLIRRFHRRIVASGTILNAKRVRFYTRPKSKQRRRAEAIRRGEIRKEYDRLRKLGKLEERSREHF